MLGLFSLNTAGISLAGAGTLGTIAWIPAFSPSFNRGRAMAFQKVFHPQWTDPQGNRAGQFGQISNLTDPMSAGKRIRFSFIESNETRFFDVAYSYVSSRGFVVAQSPHFLAPADFTVLTGLPPENAELFANGAHYLAIMAMTTPDRGHVQTLRYSRMTGTLVPNAPGEQNPKSRLITWYAEL